MRPVQFFVMIMLALVAATRIAWTQDIEKCTCNSIYTWQGTRRLQCSCIMLGCVCTALLCNGLCTTLLQFALCICTSKFLTGGLCGRNSMRFGRHSMYHVSAFHTHQHTAQSSTSILCSPCGARHVLPTCAIKYPCTNCLSTSSPVDQCYSYTCTVHTHTYLGTVGVS